jgi:hypothetical protein
MRRPHLFLIAFLTLMSSALYAEMNNPGQEIPKDFLGLADLRGSLSSEIIALEHEIKDFESRTSDIEFMKLELETKKKNFKSISNKENPSEADKEFIAESQFHIFKMEQEIKQLEASGIELGKKQLLLNSKKGLAKAVQERIANMLSPEQAFKKTMSVTFAVLIAFVIIGFFFISWQDGKIRQAIFSGQAGIQFLTLFSLVRHSAHLLLKLPILLPVLQTRSRC